MKGKDTVVGKEAGAVGKIEGKGEEWWKRCGQSGVI